MSKRTTFPVTASGATEASGEISEPDGSDRAPGLVMLQEYWGINDHMKSMTDRFAAAGFVVLTPDLFHGKVAKTAAEAGGLMQELDRTRALDEIAGAVAFLRTHPRCTGRIGVTGFCMGGALALSAACKIPDLGAVVPFYGVPSPTTVDYGKVTAPVQAHFSKTDAWATPAAAADVKKQLEASGKEMELHLYDADHAFMNDSRPEVFHEISAKLAWDRAIAFLKKKLG